MIVDGILIVKKYFLFPISQEYLYKMRVKVTFDYPTIEGMVYADTILKVSTEDFNSKQYSEKVKCLNDVGKIIWVPRKLLEEIKLVILIFN